MGLLPPAPTRRIFSRPHGAGTRPRMPCASTAASGTSSGCASSTCWPRTTATCRSRPCTALGATRPAYRSASRSATRLRPWLALHYRATPSRHGTRGGRESCGASQPLRGAGRPAHRVFGMCMGAWILWGNARQRPSWLRRQRARALWPTRGFLSTRGCALPGIALVVVCM